MRRLVLPLPQWMPAFAALLPIGLWAMLIVSIGPGDRADILKPGSAVAFAQGLRGVFPFIAAGVAAVMIGVGVQQRKPPGFGFFGPLGLATVYGLVGIVAALKSPNGSVALWWTALYLSVPIVLWGVLWNANPLDQLRRLVNVTWLIVILATAALFAVAAIYLDFVENILDPAQLLQCQDAQWFDLSSGRIRSTGVGRYAAIAGLIGISGLWQRKWRPIWIVVLLTSLTLLFYTSARGSFVGFAAGASLILLIYVVSAGKRAVITGLLVISVFVAILWTTGVLDTLVDNCLFRSARVSTASASAPSDISGAPLAGSLSGSDQGPAQIMGDGPASGEQPLALATPPSVSPLNLAEPALTGESPSGTSALATPVINSTEQAPAGKLAGGPATGEQPLALATPPSVSPLNLAEPAPTGESPSGPSALATPVINSTEQAPIGKLAGGPATGEQPADAKGPERENSPASLALATPPLNSVEQAPAGKLAGGPSTGEQPADARGPEGESRRQLITRDFFEFSGRQAVWAEGWRLFKDSPIVGFGFQADRLLLGTHMHNSVMHALLQTGMMGTVPFVLAIILAWSLVFRIIRKLVLLSASDKHMAIQAAGVLAFLTMRSFPESTGAFFGVDWLILALLLFYLQVVNNRYQSLENVAG